MQLYIYINYVRTYQLLYHQGPLFSFYGVSERINTLAKRLYMPQDRNHMEKICLIWVFLFFVEYDDHQASIESWYVPKRDQRLHIYEFWLKLQRRIVLQGAIDSCIY